MSSPPVHTDVRRSIGFWSGTALLVGTVIGAGIFRTPASIASVVSDPRIILGMWLFFGLVSMCGALALAELSTLLPKTGGVYVYLRAAYGDAAAFVFGWLYMLAAIPAGMAALAVFFGELMLGFAGIPVASTPWGLPAAASALVVVLSLANIAGVRLGTSIQNLLAVLKVGALLTLVVVVFVLGQGDAGRWWAEPAKATTVVDVATIVRSVMFSFNGWVYVSLVAGELEQPDRRLGRIIIIGTGAVVAIYLLANLAYLYLIPLAAMPGTVVAREAMRIVVGPVGSALMGAAIVTSVCGAMNGVIFTKSRVAYALARDGLSFSVLGRAHPTRATPHVSIAIQGLVAVILIFALRDPLNPSRLFDRITQYFILVEWLALLFAIAAVFVLRRTMPDAPRPYRTPGYPFVPIFFLVGTILGLGAILWSSCSRGDYSPLYGLGIVAAGFPVYFLWRRAAPVATPSASSKEPAGV